MDDMFFSRIDDFVYGDCSDTELVEFLEHIETCDKCREEYELALEVKLAMSSMPQITPPADFSQMLNERLDRETAKPAKPVFTSVYKRYSLVAACVALVAVLGIDSAKLTEPTVPEVAYLPFDNGNISSVPDDAAVTDEPVQAANASTTETVNVPVTNPVSAVTTTAAAPVQTQKPVATPAPTTSAETVERFNIPEYMDPRDHVVLASTVEKEYQIEGVRPEDVPVKERNLQAEFALLDSSKDGTIIANQKAMATLEGVQMQDTGRKLPSAHEYGVGSGSIFVSSQDRVTVNRLLNKYLTSENNDMYYLTDENFETFTNELQNRGIPYQERLISHGDNVVFKLIIS